MENCSIMNWVLVYLLVLLFFICTQISIMFSTKVKSLIFLLFITSVCYSQQVKVRIHYNIGSRECQFCDSEEEVFFISYSTPGHPEYEVDQFQPKELFSFLFKSLTSSTENPVLSVLPYEAKKKIANWKERTWSDLGTCGREIGMMNRLNEAFGQAECMNECYSRNNRSLYHIASSTKKTESHTEDFYVDLELLKRAKANWMDSNDPETIARNKKLKLEEEQLEYKQNIQAELSKAEKSIIKYLANNQFSQAVTVYNNLQFQENESYVSNFLEGEFQEIFKDSAGTISPDQFAKIASQFEELPSNVYNCQYDRGVLTLDGVEFYALLRPTIVVDGFEFEVPTAKQRIALQFEIMKTEEDYKTGSGKKYSEVYLAKTAGGKYYRSKWATTPSSANPFLVKTDSSLKRRQYRVDIYSDANILIDGTRVHSFSTYTEGTNKKLANRFLFSVFKITTFTVGVGALTTALVVIALYDSEQ